VIRKGTFLEEGRKLSCDKGRGKLAEDVRGADLPGLNESGLVTRAVYGGGNGKAGKCLLGWSPEGVREGTPNTRAGTKADKNGSLAGIKDMGSCQPP